MTAVKLAVVAVMIFFIYRAIQKAQVEFEANNFSIWQIRWPWLLLASASYVLGMLPMGANWHRLLNALQQRVPLGPAVRTHFMSQLGKYVPGKACVPAIRFALLAPYRVNVPTTFVSMLAETLSMMSVGAVVGGVLVAILFRDQPLIALAAAGLALSAGIPIMPPVLRYVVRFFEQRKAKKTGEPPTNHAEDLTWSVMLPGWLGIIPGWLLLGLSMWATMKALNLPSTQSMTIGELPLVTASYAISVVAGFMSMLPGGFLVREWFIQQMIAPSFGAMTGLLAAGLHRMVSLVSELVVSSILYVLHSRFDVRPHDSLADDAQVAPANHNSK